MKELPHEWEAPGSGAGLIGSSRTADGTSASAGQLIWLSGLIGTVTLPHVATMPPWVLASLLVAIAWRLGAALKGWPLPGLVLRVGLTVAGAVGIVVSFRRISGLDAGSALLILMLALKLLETRSTRDRSIVILIAWFVLFAGFLREQSLLSVPQLAAGIVIGLLALVQSARPAGLLPTRQAWRTVGRLLLHGLPLALALFLLFPRLPGPFWAVPTDGGASQTGLTDRMSPGDITQLAQSDEVAFRVRFSGAAPPPSALYWRGPVLEEFDGRGWRADPAAIHGREPVEAGRLPPRPGAAPVYRYEITLEPSHQRWLLPLETPLAWDIPDARLTPTLELLNVRPLERRIAWHGSSVAAGGFTARAVPGAVNLELANGTNPRAVALARRLRGASASDLAYLRGILRMFREQDFRYTLEPPALGRHPVDEFLFDTRAGFCEHYASAFAVLARAAGIPARVVAGYQGGQRNPVADYWIVRQSDAHAWTEVWLDGRWLRFDPTAAVAPERIEKGLEAALPGFAGDHLPVLGSGPWLERLAMGWDAVNATWDRWVLAFGPDQQSALLERLGIASPSLRDIALACALTMGLLLILFTWFGMRRGAQRLDPVEQAWQEFCRRIAAVARPRDPTEGAGEYAAAIAALRPELAPTVQAVAGTYLSLRYDAPAGSAEIRAFIRRTKATRLPPAP
ncbi:MAG: DUF3488 domain-containing protein [Gammaproteobacteria bacterium PRO9]|nr:DUF3488 domain-containing protein [Gammaproteobacteria bacterium PRO9]